MPIDKSIFIQDDNASPVEIGILFELTMTYLFDFTMQHLFKLSIKYLFNMTMQDLFK